MKTIKGFVKKYWITVLIFAGLVLLYYYVADVKMLNPYLFPTTEKIAAAFESNKEVMLTNMLASFKLLIPSVFLSLVIAVIFGTIMGLNKKIREALHPVIYAFSVIPSILLSPFVLLLSPTLLSASIFLVVYNIVWATLFATITGIMTIDKLLFGQGSYIGTDRCKAVHESNSAGSKSIYSGRFCKFTEKFFCNACICRNVWWRFRHGLFCKKEF